jgi:DNA polymerase III delta prime subunit
MGMIYQCGKENLKLRNIKEYLRYKFNFRTEHPDYFDADGLLCFIGPQGSGKTLSAVNYTYKLLETYPEVKLCTNLLLSDYPVVNFIDFVKSHEKVIEVMKEVNVSDDEINKTLYELYLNENRVFPFADNDDFTKYSNGEKGMIYLVDEIQLYLNSLESKNVNMDVMTQISQQRKQRKHIITTSQVFGRMAKPLREQFSNVIVCKNFFGFVQRNSLVDRDSLDSESSSDTNIKGKVKKNFIWFHNPKMYKRYDTYYVIEKGKFVAGEKQKEGVYDVGKFELSINN